MQIIIKNLIINYEVFRSVNTDNKGDILILHGWGRSLIEWRYVAKNISKNYNVYLIDLPGFGLSEIPQSPIDIYEYSEIIIDFLDRCKIIKPVAIGHSFGGRIVTILASYNNKINKAILIDPGGIEIKTLWIRFNIFIYKIFKKIKISLNIINYFNMGSLDYRNSNIIMRSILSIVVNQDLRHLFNKISIKTYVIWGSDDNVLPLKYIKEYRKNIQEVDTKIIWGADHSPHISRPDDLIKILYEILY